MDYLVEIERAKAVTEQAMNDAKSLADRLPDGPSKLTALTLVSQLVQATVMLSIRRPAVPCRLDFVAVDASGEGAVGKVAAPDAVDPVVEKVREALLQRSKLGIKKYGDTLHNKDYSEREILQHAIEESMDLSNYLMARIMKIDATPDVKRALNADHEANSGSDDVVVLLNQLAFVVRKTVGREHPDLNKLLDQVATLVKRD